MITAETVNGIRFNGNGLPVVSLYARVPAERQGCQAVIHSQVDSLLHDVRPMAEDRQLGRDAMLSIRGDIERIDEVVGEERWSPGLGRAVLLQRSRLFEEVPLTRAVRERVLVDETAWVRPMLAVLDEYHRCCVIVGRSEDRSDMGALPGRNA